MNNFYKFFCILLLLPLLYVNVRDSHDWGDDFAQYLIQSRNIVENRPQSENGLVFDQQSGEYALQAYPVGFPLLIAPIYNVFGLTIRPYLMFISLTLIILGFLLFQYFKFESDPITAMVMALLFSYNVYTLMIKSSILSEIPFTLFLFTLVLFLRKQNKNPSVKVYLIAGLLIGWIASIRAIGWICVPAIGASLLFSKRTENNSELLQPPFSLKILYILSLLIGSTFTFLLLNFILFHLPLSDFFGFYFTAVHDHVTSVWTNLIYYKNTSGYVFPLPFFSGSLTPAWLIIPLILLLIRLKKYSGFEEWLITFYILVLLFYPYTSGGFRFLFPIFPFLLRYLALGMKSILDFIPIPSGKWIVLLVLLFLLSGYIAPLKNFVEQQSEIRLGPQEVGSAEMLDYIRQHAGANDVIVFCKARAMALYSGHHTAYLVSTQNPDETDAMFHRIGVHYLVVSKNMRRDGMYDEKMVRYLKQYENRYSVQWENPKFRIYYRAS